MKKILLAILVVVVLGAILLVVRLGGPRGPALEDVQYLSEPRITRLPPTPVLVVTAKGDPANVGKEAMGLLMKAYFRVEGVPKGSTVPAPRARWPLGVDQPRDQWVGRYAMPVPERTEVPEINVEPTLSLEKETWEYGEVAEILHVGPYSEESSTVERLKAFIEREGYEIAGEHEEEYLRGPGMLFAGDPTTYLTVIRYPVRPHPADRDPAPSP